MRPNTMAPMGRIASVSVIASAICGRVLPNALATSSMTSVRMKKSNASSVQPRKPARTAFRWFARSVAVLSVSGMRGGAYQNTSGHSELTPEVLGCWCLAPPALQESALETKPRREMHARAVPVQRVRHAEVERDERDDQ